MHHIPVLLPIHPYSTSTPPPVDNLSLSHPGNRELIAITPTGDFCSYRYHTPAIVHMHLSLSHRALFVCALIAITTPNLRKMHLSLSQCRKQHVIAITHPKSYQLEGGLIFCSWLQGYFCSRRKSRNGRQTKLSPTKNGRQTEIVAKQK